MQLATLDLVIIVIYAIGLFTLAQWVSRERGGREKDSAEYFLASKTLPWWAIGASLIAANISAEQIVGMSGSGYAIGLAIASYEWMAALTLIIVGKWFLPIFLKNQIYTMPQFLEQRYGPRIRTLMAVFWLGLYVFVNLTSILWLGSIAMAKVAGVNQDMALVGLGLFALVYQLRGGLRAVAMTDIGRIRQNNEDSMYAGSQLLVVADGIGGGPAGELASDIVIRALSPLEEASHTDEASDPTSELLAALEVANRDIRQAVAEDPSRAGMGTTVTAILLVSDRIFLLHVGDSRAYLLRDDELQRLTRDDTFVQDLVDQGLLTAEEARHHPRRSLITRAVHGNSQMKVTCRELAPQVADRLLLCSDGLSDVVTDETIATLLRSHPDRKECARQLVDAALESGGPDNITVVIADVVEVDDSSTTAETVSPSEADAADAPDSPGHSSEATGP